MKKLIFGIVPLFVLGSCFGHEFIRGNGRTVHGEFEIATDYTAIDVQNGIEVRLVSAQDGWGEISCDELVLEYVSIEEKNGTVTVRYEPFVSVTSHVKTVVTMPQSSVLSHLEASSAGVIACDETVSASFVEVDISSAAKVLADIDAQEISLDASSAAEFKGRVSAREMFLDLSSSANCRVEGRVEHCDAEASSAAELKGYRLDCKSAYVDASSAGAIEISVSDELSAEVSSGGAVRYKGVPRIMRQDVSSGGSIRAVD